MLSTYLDAQEHLPYADDSNAVTPMSEENGAIIVPVYYTNMGKMIDLMIHIFENLIKKTTTNMNTHTRVQTTKCKLELGLNT